jgi:hypothetical protein
MTTNETPTTWGYGFGGDQPTHNEILELANKLYRNNLCVSEDIAYEKAKRELTPTIIQALIDQLPGIQHQSGDQFWPDIFRINDRIFARGRLDENLTYHLRHTDGVNHYDLFQQKCLIQLIEDIVRLSSTD